MNTRIIRRTPVEVNGSQSNERSRFGDRAWTRALAAIVVTCAIFGAGCGKESRAEKLYAAAQEDLREGRLDDAVAKLEEVRDRYPDTDVAARVQGDLVLVRGMSEATKLYPVRSARDLVITTARALQRYRARYGSWPDSLERLVPRDLAQLPIDPWGRPLTYAAKARRRGYLLACYGRDGVPGGSGEDGDLLVEDDRFVKRLSKEIR